MAYKVFISHSSRDTWVAEQIERYARECGAETFLDERNIQIGDNFGNVIREELNLADELVVLLTPWALKRPYIWIEVGAIWTMEKRIVVVLHGITPVDFQGNPDIPVIFKELDVLDINDVVNYFAQLQKRISNNS